jgi:hypothetical protein
MRGSGSDIANSARASPQVGHARPPWRHLYKPLEGKIDRTTRRHFVICYTMRFPLALHFRQECGIHVGARYRWTLDMSYIGCSRKGKHRRCKKASPSILNAVNSRRWTTALVWPRTCAILSTGSGHISVRYLPLPEHLRELCQRRLLLSLLVTMNHYLGARLLPYASAGQVIFPRALNKWILMWRSWAGLSRVATAVHDHRQYSKWKHVRWNQTHAG